MAKQRYKKLSAREVAEIKPGTRVLLAAFSDQPEQKGKVLMGGVVNGVVGVQVKPSGDYDDGIREVPVDQIRLILK